ncbi:MAG: hypothetical protein AB4352_00100 [Hormoscilla sp.]
MTRVNSETISLYEEAKAGLSSLVKQTAQVGASFLVMLLLTGGKPPGYTVALSFVGGVAFVAWSEHKRLTKPNMLWSATKSDEISDLLLDSQVKKTQPTLEYLALKAQQHPRQSNKRRIALTQLIRAIKESSKLYGMDPSKFPPDVYNKALEETLFYVCHKVDNYDSEKVKVITWVNTLLQWKIFDELRCYSEKVHQEKHQVKHRDEQQEKVEWWAAKLR